MRIRRMYERTKNTVLLRSVHFLPIISANGPAINGAVDFTTFQLIKNSIKIQFYLLMHPMELS